jgi:hypothetical protein
MEVYYDLVPSDLATTTPTESAADDADQESDVDEFDAHRKLLLVQSIRREEWRAELRRYLSDIPQDVTKETDIVEWWGVSVRISNYHFTEPPY